MSFLRNPEIRKTAVLIGIVDLVLIAVGFIVNLNTGYFAIGAVIILNTIFVMSTYHRYKNIADLSHDIDRVLHGVESINLSAYHEGELSILEGELTKMIMSLRQSRDLLQEDKTRLYNFIADISHQLRTPLTSLNLTVTLLSEDVSEERKLELLHEMRGLLSRISWLIESLLRMSKLDAGMTKLKCGNVELNELIKKAFAPLEVAFDVRGLRLVSEVEGSFEGDIDWSAEAVGNILKNAMEHTPENGTVYIIGKETAIYTELVIRDTGTGFEKDDIPHLFERFYRGKNSSDSSFGIGLSLARLIISLQNGTIKAENHPDGGAQFIIRFYKSIV